MTQHTKVLVETLDPRPSTLAESLPFLEAFAPRFRGEIWEDDAEVPMGKGYANEGEPFDIESAQYLKPVWRAIKDTRVRLVVIRAAVQMLKTFAGVEKPAAYFIKHDPGDMAIYDCDIEAANDHAKSRFMPFLKSVPGIALQVAEAEANNRFDITTTEFYLPGMTLRLWPLNESSTQRITLRYVFISDAFLSKKTGLIGQAKARTTQHPHDKKIIIESQGGEEGDDFDVEWKTTDMQLIHTVCPECGTGQPWEFHRQRPDDFAAVLPRASVLEIFKRHGCEGSLAMQSSTLNPPPSIVAPAECLAELEAARGALTEVLRKPERRECGFKRGDEDLIKRADGSYNESEILRQTYYECFHCGSTWRDTPATRRALDEASYYVPSNAGALPENVGFSFPAWAGQRLPWGGEFVMLGYLRAKAAFDRYGNIEPLKQWYQKRAGIAWKADLTRPVTSVISGSSNIDPEKKIPDEACRVMKVDCQQDDEATARTGKSTMGIYWWVARAIDLHGNLVQLARGWGRKEDWQADQKRLQISNENVGIDGGFWRNEVIDLAAANIAPYDRRIRRHGRWRVETVWHTYTVLVGNGKRVSWRWADGHARSISPMQPQSRAVTIKGQRVNIKVPLYEWSNLGIKDQLDQLIRGAEGRVKFESLGRAQLNAALQMKEAGNLTYENQMAAEYRTMKKNGEPYWEKSRPDNHYWDCECGCLALFGLGGYLGIAAAPEGETE